MRKLTSTALKSAPHVVDDRRDLRGGGRGWRAAPPKPPTSPPPLLCYRDAIVRPLPPPSPLLPRLRVFPPPSLMPSPPFPLSGLVLWLFDSLIPFCRRLYLLPRLVNIFIWRFHIASSAPRHHFLEIQAPPFAEATYLRPPSKGKRPLLAFFSTLLTRFSGPPRTDRVQASPLALPTSPPPP